MYVDNDTSDHELVIGALEDADNQSHGGESTRENLQIFQ